MVDNIEKRQEQYRKARHRVEKMYPEARLKVNENAGYFIEDENAQNIIAQKYPDLAFAGTVMSAYINLDVASHWNKIETRNSKRFRKDQETVCVVGNESDTSSGVFEDYVDYKPDQLEE